MDLARRHPIAAALVVLATLGAAVAFVVTLTDGSDAPEHRAEPAPPPLPLPTVDAGTQQPLITQAARLIAERPVAPVGALRAPGAETAADAARVSAALGERLRGETIDPEWAPPTEAALRAALADLPETDVESVECRATLCRVVAVHGEEDARAALAARLESSDSPVLASERSVFTGGEFAATIRTEVFVARSGTSLGLAALAGPAP